MKTGLKVILLFLLMLATGRISTETTGGNNVGGKDIQVEDYQDNKISAATPTLRTSMGDYSLQTVLTRVPCTDVSPNQPTFSPSLLKLLSHRLWSMAVAITPHHDKQYDVDAPFYCTPPSGYYIFALRHIII